MNIISHGAILDTDRNAVVLVLKNDDELNELISKLAKTQVRTSGIRIISLMPDNVPLTPLQQMLIDTIEGLDGIGGKETDQIVDASIDRLKDILNSK